MVRPWLVALSVLSVGLSGQAHQSTTTVVLKAARLWDGKADRVVTPGVVVIKGGEIAAVGPRAEVPPGADVIDLGDTALMPGFVDAHTHLTADFSDDFTASALKALQMTQAEQALNAAANARTTLLAGFTTVRDLGSNDEVDIGLRNAIERGIAVGPHMLVSGYALGTTGGHCDLQSGFRRGLFGHEAGIEIGIADGADAMRRAVRANHKYGATVIKVCATGGVLSLADAVDTPQLTQAELDALVDEAHALRLKAAAHAQGAEGAKRAIRAGIDSIEHGSFLDDEALDMMKARGTFYVPTMMAIVGLLEVAKKPGGFPPAIQQKALAAAAAVQSTVRRAVNKGVKIALGTDAAVYQHGRNAGEFSELVGSGMKPLDALRAGTTVAAELLGVGVQTGSLEPGKRADIVAVAGDPLLDVKATEKVIFVMKKGVAYRNDTRGTQP